MPVQFPQTFSLDIPPRHFSSDNFPGHFFVDSSPGHLLPDIPHRQFASKYSPPIPLGHFPLSQFASRWRLVQHFCEIFFNKDVHNYCIDWCNVETGEINKTATSQTVNASIPINETDVEPPDPERYSWAINNKPNCFVHKPAGVSRNYWTVLQHCTYTVSQKFNLDNFWCIKQRDF